jgi:hypothetical protein
MYYNNIYLYIIILLITVYLYFINIIFFFFVIFYLLALLTWLQEFWETNVSKFIAFTNKIAFERSFFFISIK